MAILDDEIKYFTDTNEELLKHHYGKWVLIHNATLINSYDTFDSAAKVAVNKFGKGPYLIRQVGAPDFVMPASVMYG